MDIKKVTALCLSCVLIFAASTVAFGLDKSVNFANDIDYENCEVGVDEDGTITGIPDGVVLEEVSDDEAEMLEERRDNFNEIIGLDEDEFKVNVKPAVVIPQQEVKAIVDEYFEVRSNSLNGYVKRTKSSENMLSGILDTKDNALKAKEYKRLDMKKDMEGIYDINIISADVYTSVERFEKVCSKSSKDVYEADVYEWTWIYYESEGSAIIDRMGYGISHTMDVEVDKNDIAVITKDDFDDTYVFNYEDTGEALDTQQVLVDDVSTEVLDPNEVEPNAINTTYSLNLNKMIEYADKYVPHDIASDPSVSHIEGYNLEDYTYAYGNDCANFVSQCLVAGGLNMTDTWKHDNSHGTNNLSSHSTYNWCNVGGLVTEFGGSNFLTEITSGETNVYPGNPVVTNNLGHIAICVGYNGSGKPIINGHTRDVYHQLLQKGSLSTSYYWTMKFFTSNKMGMKPSNAVTISPTSSFQSVGSVSIPKNESKFYKFHSNTAGKYTFKFNNTTSGKKMYAVLYRATKNSSNDSTIYLYQVQSHTSTTNTPLSFTMTVSGNYDRWYYLRFYHKYTSSYGLNFSYKFAAS